MALMFLCLKNNIPGDSPSTPTPILSGLNAFTLQTMQKNV